jgi:hypothetical protein
MPSVMQFERPTGWRLHLETAGRSSYSAWVYGPSGETCLDFGQTPGEAVYHALIVLRSKYPAAATAADDLEVVCRARLGAIGRAD